jgi:hypothetical protein
VDELRISHPGAPAHAMAVDEGPVQEARVFLRGNPGSPGPEVPRRFPGVLGGRIFKDGSGRLELAQAVASRDNPLTARVWVNRVWHHHFGAGLVRTPSDFGRRGEPPTHPELLDWLALRFVADGWSTKALHRLILSSRTWQQSCADDPRAREADPENRLLWRQNRRRLDFESMRDAMLASAGRLDLAMGGRPVPLEGSTRRTLYAFVERQNVPGVLRAFDVASSDLHSPRRFTTTVPQQALWLMNSPFAIEQARELAARAKGDVAELFRIVYARTPSEEERALCRRYLDEEAARKADAASERAAAWSYGWGEAGKSFEPLPHFTGSAWQGGPQLPDRRLGWVLVSAGGGHPGKDAKHASIRRWTAPRDLTVTLTGSLSHPSHQGDGVVGRVVSSRSGELGTWTVKRGETMTNVRDVEMKAGETVDFVVEPGANEHYDSFEWAPEVAAGGEKWRAREDFAGPRPKPMAPAEKLAQALMMSNEAQVVD